MRPRTTGTLICSCNSRGDLRITNHKKEARTPYMKVFGKETRISVSQAKEYLSMGIDVYLK